MLVAGPRAGSFQDDKAQTICLSLVTSNTCTLPAQCEVLLSPATQHVMIV